MQYEMDSIRYQLPSYHHNLVEMWLIRLSMTPRFSVSSKDGSNIEGCSASSSEDDCNIVFTWVLDLVPYGSVFWGAIEPLVGFFTSRVGRMVLGAGSDGLSLPCVFQRSYNCHQFTLHIVPLPLSGLMV